MIPKRFFFLFGPSEVKNLVSRVKLWWLETTRKYNL